MLADRVEKYFGTHVQANETIPTQNTHLRAETIAKEGAHEAVAKPVVKFDQALIEREINALGNLLGDRFKRAVSTRDFLHWGEGVGGGELCCDCDTLGGDLGRRTEDGGRSSERD
jgi:hypothetical protein